MKKIQKPKDGEFAPYAIAYIDQFPDDGNILKLLKEQMKKTKEFFLSIPEEKLTYRYAEKKWSIKEILLHFIDTERIYGYRALRIARNDKIEHPGFDQELFISNVNADKRKVKDILKEYEAVRKATLLFFNGLERKALSRKGISNGNPLSVRAIPYLIAGHELHHLQVIKEKYL
jgi:uncharacterized damage-inducible protein DinB